MSTDASQVVDGVAIIRIAGTLGAAAVADLQSRLGEAIQRHGKLSLLLRAEDFAGWDAGADWSDLSFQTFQDTFDPYIKRAAVVVDVRWQDAVLAFLGSGLRPFPIECFAPAELERARDWLAPA